MSDELRRLEPKLGLGTMGIEDPERIASAIEAGYRHLDTAQIYENEAVVGRGIERASVEREDLSLATKVWADSLAPEDVLASTRESLDRLGVGCLGVLADVGFEPVVLVRIPAHREVTSARIIQNLASEAR